MTAKSAALFGILLTGLLYVSPAPSQAARPETAQDAVASIPRGLWSGAIGIMGAELNIMVTFTVRGDSLSASIDIPQQMALGLPLTNVTWKSPRIHFELPAGPGLAVFDGRAWQDTMTGDFTQAGIRGTFRLQRGTAASRIPPSKAEEPPPPYLEEEVSFQADTLTICGTLTMPREKGPHPAVILITGSGAHNRDEELFGFRPFRVIADYLTRRGLAVLRCDDRGVGCSTGNKSGSTSADHVSDVLASVRYLQRRPEINAEQIGLCGHSEGGIIAPMAAAASASVAFIVLVAGPAVPGDSLILYQLESLMREGGADNAQIAKTLAQQRRAFSCVRNDSGWETLAAEVKREVAASMATMNSAQRKAITDSAGFVNSTVEARFAAARTPWFRYFIDFDPLPTLRQVRCPVLALFGELDMQVPVSLNKAPMERVLGNGGSKDWKVEVIPGANHLFQKAVKGHPSEYATLAKEFTPGFLELVTRWIVARVSPASGQN